MKSYLSGMPVCRLGFNERNLSRIEDDQEEESLGIPENQLNLLKRIKTKTTMKRKVKEIKRQMARN